jgi:hypothetical protein
MSTNIIVGSGRSSRQRGQRKDLPPLLELPLVLNGLVAAMGVHYWADVVRHVIGLLGSGRSGASG